MFAEIRQEEGTQSKSNKELSEHEKNNIKEKRLTQTNNIKLLSKQMDQSVKINWQLHLIKKVNVMNIAIESNDTRRAY